MKNIIIIFAILLSLSVVGQTYTSDIVLYRDIHESSIDSIKTTIKIKKSGLSISNKFSTDNYYGVYYDKFYKMYSYENEYSKVIIMKDKDTIYVQEYPMTGAYKIIIATKSNRNDGRRNSLQKSSNSCNK